MEEAILGKRVRRPPRRFDEEDTESLEEKKAATEKAERLKAELKEKRQGEREEEAEAAMRRKEERLAAAAERGEDPAAARVVKPKKKKQRRINADWSDDEDGGYEDMLVPELKELCAVRGLAVGGSKAELLERVQNRPMWTRPYSTFYNNDPRYNSSITLQKHAKSGRSSCQRCGFAIQQGMFRIGYEHVMTSFTADFGRRDIVRFMHAECFAAYPPKCWARGDFDSVPISSLLDNENDNDDERLLAKLRAWWVKAAPPVQQQQQQQQQRPRAPPAYIAPAAPKAYPAPASQYRGYVTPAPKMYPAPAPSQPRAPTYIPAPTPTPTPQYRAAAPSKHYAVVTGNTVGVFAHNDSFSRSMSCKGSKGRGFPSLEAAHAWFSVETGGKRATLLPLN